MNKNAAVLIIIMSLTTIALRFLPFFIFSSSKDLSKTIRYLGDVLPSAVIGMLIVYCLRDINFTLPPYGLRELLASLIVILMQIIKRNSILSIFLGTASYILLLAIL